MLVVMIFVSGWGNVFVGVYGILFLFVSKFFFYLVLVKYLCKYDMYWYF